VTATATARFLTRPLRDAGPAAPRDQAAHFTTVATAVVRGRTLGLSPWAKLLYVALRSYAGLDGTCFPGYATLRADVGCGLAQLSRAVRELEAAGLVTRRRRGQGKTTLYTVRAPGTMPPAAPQTRPRRGSRVAPAAGLDPHHSAAEQDSEEQDPAEHHHQAPPTSQSETQTRAGDDALLVSLEGHGVTKRIAVCLIESRDAQTIREQLDWYAYRPAAKNPAGALVLAIREHWPAPPAWFEAQARAAAVARQTEEEAARRAEEAACRREWAARPPEERIAGRLQFWVEGQRRKRREPTPAEIEAKRAALLAELALAAGSTP
jgi:hypothetical protein